MHTKIIYMHANIIYNYACKYIYACIALANYVCKIRMIITDTHNGQIDVHTYTILAISVVCFSIVSSMAHLIVNIKSSSFNC